MIRRPRRLVLVLSALAVAVTAAACDDPNPVARLTLEPVLATGSLRASDTLDASLRLSNRTSSRVELSGNSCLFRYEVRTAVGDSVVIPAVDGGCQDIGLTIRVEPGESVVATYSHNRVPVSHLGLAPGAYRLRYRVQAREGTAWSAFAPLTILP